MSTSKRRSTVHDLAALRLHPDGTRVALSQTNKNSRKSKYTTQDHRGNWIAQDAGGIGRVKTRRAASKTREASEEPDDEEPEYESVAGPSHAASKGKGRARDDGESDEDVLKDSRAKRRRLFNRDIGLHPSGSSQNVERSQSAPAREEPSSSLPGMTTPTSDLLKCIHYFASTYYSEMGQLRDSSKEFRREKKLRRLARLERQAALGGSKSTDGGHPSEEDESSSSSSEEDGSESDGKSNASKAVKPKRRSRNARRSVPHIGVDMYKVFDGSALMAIGMLLQHHVDSLLTPHIPEGWEEAMAIAEVPKKQRRKDRMVKMRIIKDDRHQQFLEDDDEDDEEEDDGEGDGDQEDDMLVDREFEDLGGDMEADEDYVPGDD